MKKKFVHFLMPLGLVATSALSASAGRVTVTGANAANGLPGGVTGTPGGAGGTAIATTTTPGDPSNSAAATGGKGGVGSGGGVRFCGGLDQIGQGMIARRLSRPEGITR
jgi:hypothetical protein